MIVGPHLPGNFCTALSPTDQPTDRPWTHQQPKFVSKDEKARTRFPGKRITSLSALKNHLRSYKALPLVGEMTRMAEKRYRYTKLPVLTVFASVDHERNAKGYTYVANRVRKVAQNYKGE